MCRALEVEGNLEGRIIANGSKMTSTQVACDCGIKRLISPWFSPPLRIPEKAMIILAMTPLLE